MSARSLFYMPNCAIEDRHLKLDGPQARHILGARRLRVDDEIDVTNGRGDCLGVRIVDIGSRQQSLELEVISKKQIDAPSKRIILASAIAKGDRQATLVSMACQLGVSEIWPVEFDYSITKYSENSRQRWQRIVVEACKQSRRLWFPQITPLVGFKDAVNYGGGALSLLAHQQGDESPIELAQRIGSAKSVILVVGPEGGLSDAELRYAAQNQVSTISLGGHILRIETACSAIIAAVNQLGK